MSILFLSRQFTTNSRPIQSSGALNHSAWAPAEAFKPSRAARRDAARLELARLERAPSGPMICQQPPAINSIASSHCVAPRRCFVSSCRPRKAADDTHNGRCHWLASSSSAPPLLLLLLWPVSMILLISNWPAHEREASNRARPLCKQQAR